MYTILNFVFSLTSRSLGMPRTACAALAALPKPMAFRTASPESGIHHTHRPPLAVPQSASFREVSYATLSLLIL